MNTRQERLSALGQDLPNYVGDLSRESEIDAVDCVAKDSEHLRTRATTISEPVHLKACYRSRVQDHEHQESVEYGDPHKKVVLM